MTLKSLTGKDAIIIVDRGNTAIFHSLEIAKKLGKTQVVIQDQGAWLVYKQYPKKIGLELIVLKTDYGLIDAKTLAASIDKDSALLITSMAGYIAVQDMDAIYNICKKKGCLLINDITGTIGLKEGTVGDVLVCSFGEGKPLNYGKGGLIAADNGLLDQVPIERFTLGDDFQQTLNNLKIRQDFFDKTNKTIKEDLKDFDIIHKKRRGINVAVKFNGDTTKQRIIYYCQKNNFKYRICKKVKNSLSSLFSFIKVNEDAVSIEVQEL